MLISIIVPVYKVEKYLPKCMSSILNQSFRDFEVILIDDGSPDGCGRLCDRYAQTDKRIRVIHKNNGGLSDARNAGLEVAEGEFLTFVDSDDYLEPDYLASLLSLIKRDSKCKIARVNHYIDRGKKITANSPVNGEITIFTRKEAVEAVLYHDRVDVSAWSGLYQRDIFENVRFPKGRLFEDTYIFSELISQTDSYVYGDIPLYHYVQRTDSIVHQTFTLKNLEYLDAVKRLTDYALKEYPFMETACHRRGTHACLSVLRYMEHIEPEYRAIRDNLRFDALKYYDEICTDLKSPSRDKMALKLLKIGYFPFYKGWKIYSRLRR